jgi:hypothetical protein
MGPDRPRIETAPVVEELADGLAEPNSTTLPEALCWVLLTDVFAAADENPAYVQLGCQYVDRFGKTSHGPGYRQFVIAFRQYLLSVRCVKSGNENYYVVPEWLKQSSDQFLSSLTVKVSEGELNRETLLKLQKRLKTQERWLNTVLVEGKGRTTGMVDHPPPAETPEPATARPPRHY